MKQPGDEYSVGQRVQDRTGIENKHAEARMGLGGSYCYVDSSVPAEANICLLSHYIGLQYGILPGSNHILIDPRALVFPLTHANGMRP